MLLQYAALCASLKCVFIMYIVIITLMENRLAEKIAIVSGLRSAVGNF